MNDEEIKQALFKRAVGYESDEVIEEYTSDENGNPILSKRKITKKFNPPDIAALRFLLEQGQVSDDEISKMTDKQLLQEKERLLQLLKQKEKDDENANCETST
ncbi:MAG: hypothetical protein J6J24_03715 [Clostridia bacterium]|nr:hypothetical protein [Clostridia bacterium]